MGDYDWMGPVLGTVVVGGVALKRADTFLQPPNRLHKKRKQLRKGRKDYYAFGNFKNIGY